MIFEFSRLPGNSKKDKCCSRYNHETERFIPVCLIIGSKKEQQKATTELQAKPLLCGSFETKQTPEYKWLGQILSAKGLADSVARTVSSKEGKIRGACLEIAVIVNDW